MEVERWKFRDGRIKDRKIRDGKIERWKFIGTKAWVKIRKDRK